MLRTRTFELGLGAGAPKPVDSGSEDTVAGYLVLNLHLKDVVGRTATLDEHIDRHFCAARLLRVRKRPG